MFLKLCISVADPFSSNNIFLFMEYSTSNLRENFENKLVCTATGRLGESRFLNPSTPEFQVLECTTSAY